MFVFNDVTSDAHAQTCTLPYRFGSEEVFKKTLLHLIGHTLAIVGNADDQVVIIDSNADANLGRVTFCGGLRFLPYRIASVIHHVQHRPAQVLRDDHHTRYAFLIGFVQSDIESLVVGPHGMIRQAHVFLHYLAHIGRHAFVLLTARYQQYALYDAHSTVAVRRNLLHILLETIHNVVEVFAVCFWQQLGVILHYSCQVAEEFVGHLREVDDKIQRVLNLVGNTSTEHTERCQFLLLLQLLF